MLAELPESQATGELARIYGELRELCAVPYVASMQRHLATRPGWLEWTWAALRPAFVDGAAQTRAWRLAGPLGAPPLPPLSRSALRLLGVDAVAERAIAGVCESFVRVSPINLMFSGMLRGLLGGVRPAGPGASGPAWTPPAPGPALPALVDPAALDREARVVLLSLGTEVGGRPFVPGLYRMLGHWPAYLAHVATVLRPRLDDPATVDCCRAVLARLDAAVPALLDRLPALPPTPPMPPAGEAGEILAALERYRETSPQMIVFGSLLRDALPAPD